MNLIETYKRKLAVSEAVCKKATGESLTDTKKLTIARVLANTSAFLNESFASSSATQRTDLGTYKKFCLDLTTVALPNLIANELVIVKPMAAMTGYIQYLSFEAGVDKGGVKAGDVFNDPFKLGEMTEDRARYTGSAVVETIGDSDTEFVPAWTPVSGKITFVKASGEEEEKELSDGKVSITAGDYKKAKYVYDNVVIPQEKIPTLKATMRGIALEAHARRIAIYYSQMTAYQSKIETGADLGDLLATQAQAELKYEIDTEIVKMLDDGAGDASAELVFNKTVPTGVSMSEHYESFAEVLELASQVIYDRTQKHAANYMVCASNVKPILALMRGWKAASAGKINGPYFAGTINGIKVFVSPAVAAGRFFLGFNGDDLVTSAGIYAPYMAIVPTQLLGFADGTMSQGFSTLYDAKLINPSLLVAGKVIAEAQVVTTKEQA